MHSSDKRPEKSSRLGRRKIAVGGEPRIKAERRTVVRAAALLVGSRGCRRR